VNRLAIALLLALAAGPAAAQERLRIGTEGAYPPFNARDAAGELVGFDVEIMNGLCARIGATCEWLIRDWDALVPSLLGDEIDVVAASLPINGENRRQTALTAPYYRTPAAFATRREGGPGEIRMDAVDGLVFASISASVQGNWLAETAPVGGARVRLFGTLEEAGTELAEGRVAAVFADKFALDEWLRTNPEGACCRLVPRDIHEARVAGEGVAFAVRPDQTRLRDRLDAALEAMKADGTYATIARRWFRFDPR
jgi:polar amino acid transport system substrate-binding protein